MIVFPRPLLFHAQMMACASLVSSQPNNSCIGQTSSSLYLLAIGRPLSTEAAVGTSAPSLCSVSVLKTDFSSLRCLFLFFKIHLHFICVCVVCMMCVYVVCMMCVYGICICGMYDVCIYGMYMCVNEVYVMCMCVCLCLVLYMACLIGQRTAFRCQFSPALLCSVSLVVSFPVYSRLAGP